MAALWEVKQHSVVHLAARKNDSSVCECVCGECMHACDTLSDHAVHNWVFVNAQGFSQRHARLRVCRSVCSCLCVAVARKCVVRAHNCLICREAE